MVKRRSALLVVCVGSLFAEQLSRAQVTLRLANSARTWWLCTLLT